MLLLLIDYLIIVQKEVFCSIRVILLVLEFDYYCARFKATACVVQTAGHMYSRRISARDKRIILYFVTIFVKKHFFCQTSEYNYIFARLIVPVHWNYCPRLNSIQHPLTVIVGTVT